MVSSEGRVIGWFSVEKQPILPIHFTGFAFHSKFITGIDKDDNVLFERIRGPPLQKTEYGKISRHREARMVNCICFSDS